MENQVEAGSAISGRPLADLGLPAGSLIVSLQRQGHAMLPAAGTIVEVEDRLGVLTRADDIVTLRRLLATNPKQALAREGRGLGPGRLI